MKLIKEKAIVLDTINANRSDKIIYFYGETHGLVKGVAEGSRLIKSRFLGCFELLNLIEICYFFRETQELVNIRECEVLSSLAKLGEEPEYYFFIFYICELAKEFATAGSGNVKFFNLLKEIHKGIKERVKLNILARWSEIQFLHEYGAFSYLKICTTCRKDLSKFEELKYLSFNGELKCKDCCKSNDILLNNNIFILMNKLLYAKIENLKLIGNKRKELKDIGQILKDILRNHLQKRLHFYDFYKKIT